jgi:hypothetical protein
MESGVFRPGIKKPLLVQPTGAQEHVGQVGAQNTHQAGLRAEMPPHRPQRRRGHRQVAQPIGQENGNFHGDSG